MWQGDLPFAAVAVEPAEAAGVKPAAETVPPPGSSLSAGHWEDCILPVSHQDLQTVDLKQNARHLLDTFKKILFAVLKQSCFNWLLLSWPATGIKGSSLTISHYSNYSIRQLLFFSRQDSRYLFQQDDFPRNGWKVTMAIRWFRCYGYLKSFSDESINIKIELGANTEGRECSLTFSSNTTAVKCTQLLLKQYGL